MTSQAEQHFMAELRLGTERLRKEISYNPTYFNRMISDHGPVEACRRLIEAGNASDGFTTLWEHQRLEMSVEALALLPRYDELFDEGTRSKARRKLGDHGFDVDAFLRNRTASPPAWTPGA